jgi:hypothetical protein
MKKLNYILLALSLIIVSCGGGGGSDPTPDQPSPPVKSVLIFPEQNSICTTGTTVSPTQSSLTFKWNSAANTDSYDVTIKNLLTSASTTQTTTATQLTVSLDVSTPYSWSVTSKSGKVSTTAVSDIWKFYNSGPGVISYAPFPAELITPSQNQYVSAANGPITLTWTGSDVDNDIVGYDVYFDTSATPALFKSGVTDSKLSGIIVTAGKTYYWKIITKDSKGNVSNSELFSFAVN